MRSLPPPRFNQLSDAIMTCGEHYIAGWNGSERALASPGCRHRGPQEASIRAQLAIRLLERFVRAGNVGMLLHDERGNVIPYLQTRTEVLSTLWLPPQETTLPGLAELRSGEMMHCEIDLSPLRLPSRRGATPGRKRQFLRYRELAESVLEEHGPHTPNSEANSLIVARIGAHPVPASTQSKVILKLARECIKGRWQSANDCQPVCDRPLVASPY